MSDHGLLISAIDAFQKGRTAEARLLFQQLARLRKRDVRPWLILAQLAEAPEDKLECYRQAQQVNPDYPGLQETILHLQEWLAAQAAYTDLQEQALARVAQVNQEIASVAPVTSGQVDAAPAVIAPPVQDVSVQLPATSGQVFTALGQAFSAPLPFKDALWTLAGFVFLTLLVGAAEMPAWLTPFRLLLGLAYVLFIPGYWLAAALFPHADDLDGLQRTAISFGLSLAVIALSALALDRLPWGIRLYPIVLSYLVFYGVCIPLALWRRTRLSAAERYTPRLSFDLRGFWQELERPLRIALLVMLGALVAMIVTGASIVLLPKPAEFFTEFYILGKEGLAESYPREGIAGEALSLTAGITNREGEAHSYRMEARDATGLIGKAGPFDLQDGETLEQPFTFTPLETGEDVQVDFLLFLDDQSEPYRSLRLFLEVNEPDESNQP